MLVCYLFLAVLATINAQSNTHYIYQNFTGDFTNKNHMEFSIYIYNSTGLFFYAFDLIGNKIVIKFQARDENISLQVNNLTTIFKSQNFCGCAICADRLMTIAFRSEKNRIFVICNRNAEVTVQSTMKKKNPVQINTNQRNSINSNRIFVKIGRINSNVPKSLLTYQIIACLAKFNFNERNFTFNKYGEYVLPSCQKLYNETVCNKKNCTFRQDFQNIFQCSNPSPMEVSDMQNNLVKSGRARSFVRHDDSNRTLFIVRLTKKHDNLKNYCLMELKQKDDSIINIQINQLGQILWTKLGGITTPIIMSRPSLLQLNTTLLITFNDTNITIRVCDGTDIFIFEETFLTVPNQLNVGFSSQISFCNVFDGSIDIRWDQRSFSILTDHRTPFQMFLIIFGILLTIILIIGLIIFLWSKRHKFNEREQNDEAVPFQVIST